DIHGAYPDLDLYVFTYRDPANFFESVDVSLVAGNASAEAALADLKRHDRVRIEGTLMDNRSAQTPTATGALGGGGEYAPTPPIPAYAYEATIPEDLRGEDSALFLVHAVHAGGSILVVEHGDVV